MLLAAPIHPQKINLKKLKKGIDVKIQAILRYLEQQESTNAVPSVPSVASAHHAAYTHQSTMTIKQQNQQSESTTLDIRQSLGTDIGFSTFVPPKDAQFRKFSLSEEMGKIPVSSFMGRYSEEDKGFQQQNCDQETPLKNQNEGIITQLQNSARSGQSDRKRQEIQMKASLKIFGAPLSNSLTANITSEILDIKLYSSLKGNAESLIQTDRSKSKRSKKNSQKQNESGTPAISRSKQKRLGSKKTPHKTPSNHHSTAKRLYEYFSGFERNSQPLTQTTINRMKTEVEQLYKQTRKQGQENNVRAKLLKRIENCKIKV